MEGYSDYVCVLDAEISREFERDALGVEVPYMVEAYKKWMNEIDGKTKNVANTYVSYLKMVDKKIFLGEDDFFYLLPQKIKDGNFLEVASLFDKYLEIINDWFEYAKKEDLGISPKVISDCRSGFKNYRRFIEESLLRTMNGEKTSLSDMKEAVTYKRLFAEDDFFMWLTKDERIGVGSAQSYISRLKRLNRIISEAISAKLPNSQYDILSLIPQWLKEQKGYKVIKLLEGVDEKMVCQIHTNDTHLMPISALRDCVSALRAYIKFILEEYIVEVLDEEELSTDDIAEISEIGNGGEIKKYDYLTLEKNFRFRLITQNRMSVGKDVFFPISIIQCLFSLSEKALKTGSVGKGEYKWFNRWIDDCIAEIQVQTDRGTFIMAELNKSDTFIINTTTKEVTVTLQDGKTARMLTSTEDDSASPRFMEVEQLRNIHIDHTPLISNVLSDNISELPAMVKLTQIIRKVAETAKLSFVVSNFSTIKNELIKNEEDVAEMLKMLPELKNELELIRSKSTLCLMEAKYNLRKK